MGKCFICNKAVETRKIFVNEARGYSEMCIDCIIDFFKIPKV